MGSVARGPYQVGGVVMRCEGADQVAAVGGDDAHLFWTKAVGVSVVGQ